MSWEDQGRQYHMWFGHGTGADKAAKAAPGSSVGGQSTADRVLALAYGALALPLALTLALAFFNGLLWDALTVQFLKSTEAFALDAPAVPELAIGWSILLFGVLALLVHGLRPLFLKGRWELHCISSGFCASVILLAEYLMITFKRHGLIFPRDLWGRILVPGFFAMVMAIPVYFLFRLLATALGYTVRVYPTKARL